MRAWSSRPVAAALVLFALSGPFPVSAAPGLSGPAPSAGALRALPRNPVFAPRRSAVQAGDVFAGAGPSAFQRRAFGYGTLLGRGTVAPYGFGGYGYGGYAGYGLGGYGIAAGSGGTPLPLTGGLLDDANGTDAGLPPPPPFLPPASAATAGPPGIGIPASPVKPPAVYVIGGERRAPQVRSGAREDGIREAEAAPRPGPRFIEVRPGRS